MDSVELLSLDADMSVITSINTNDIFNLVKEKLKVVGLRARIEDCQFSIEGKYLYVSGIAYEANVPPTSGLIFSR